MATPNYNINDALKLVMERLHEGNPPLETYNTNSETSLNNQSSGITVNNFPTGQTVSLSNTSNMWINNKSCGITVNNFPASMTVSNFPLIQTVTFLPTSSIAINNHPASVTVNNFPSSLTIALASDANVWLNNRSSGITVNNFPTSLTVSFSVPLIIVKQPLRYVMYDGSAGATITQAIDVSMANLHSFYFHWNGPRNGIKVFIEHNSTVDSVYPWIEIFNKNAPNGNSLQTLYQIVSETHNQIGAVRARITGNYSGGNLVIISTHS